jgi:hypothetical protein
MLDPSIYLSCQSYKVLVLPLQIRAVMLTLGLEAEKNASGSRYRRQLFE